MIFEWPFRRVAGFFGGQKFEGVFFCSAKEVFLLAKGMNESFG